LANSELQTRQAWKSKLFGESFAGVLIAESQAAGLLMAREKKLSGEAAERRRRYNQLLASDHDKSD